MRLELLVGPPPRTTLLCRQSPQGNLAAQQVENGNPRYRDQRRALPGTFLEQGESLLGNGGFGARAESNGSQHKQPRRVCRPGGAAAGSGCLCFGQTIARETPPLPTRAGSQGVPHKKRAAAASPPSAPAGQPLHQLKPAPLGGPRRSFQPTDKLCPSEMQSPLLPHFDLFS